ncbi:hypothetical protein ABIF65_003742 [Bradyrhizobium japonicum]|uniref:hypothetical protein n=1 Tax=Bradyrhizobium liaoningense TaxID=43992 RepID=UPI001BAC9A47|nr:hypothetical protein [Bradyrhizobium liaoningense]MBR0998776.1 hypothetical protein [Bradyrhizobium liaoningense]MBR1030057.1 hypothetical protein [Bradyrhizobium liaoningense]
MKKPKPFATEADLCKRFIASLPEGWTPYAEHAGWDILLVRNADGFQIGIEAKLRLNSHVITQSLEDYGIWCADRAGPDCRAVLVPWGEFGFETICKYIGITIIHVKPASDDRPRWAPAFDPYLPGENHGRAEDWPEWAPAQRHVLPDYVPDVVAGSPSPVQLTEWKIAAIKIAVILEKRGFLIRADFKHVGIDHRRWLPSATGWLSLDAGRYIQGPHFPRFKKQHPRVYDEIAADYESWKPIDPIGPLPLPEPKQESLL